jgi:2-C-methyl-D-erythritol 4-phosphate cytidylyltransferase
MKTPYTATIVLLAGGRGSRMKSVVPKQYMELQGKPVALHSYEHFINLPEAIEIVVVCDPSFRSLFPAPPNGKIVSFALPGERRQDSVYNGFMAKQCDSDLVCIHDAARPFITDDLIRRVMDSANEHGAATAAVPVKFTVKEADNGGFVMRTPDRSLMWEIQTPQVVRPGLLTLGFHKALSEGLTVTDDVSLIEMIGHPVKLVEGGYMNLKITTPEDFALAKQLYYQS